MEASKDSREPFQKTIKMDKVFFWPKMEEYTSREHGKMMK